MKILNSLALLLFLSFTLNAQIINNGASIIIQDGAKVAADMNMANQSDGLIQNDGYLSLKGSLKNTELATVQGDGDYALTGNWENKGTFFADASNVIFLSSSISRLDANGYSFNQLTNLKEGGGEIRLASDLSIMERLDMEHGEDLGTIRLGAYDLSIEEGASIRGARKGRHIVTNSRGHLILRGIDEGVFPVGVSESAYNPVEFAFYSSEFQDDIAVRALAEAPEDANTSLRQNAVQVNWEIEGDSDMLSYVRGIRFAWEETQMSNDFDETACAVANLNRDGDWKQINRFQAASVENKLLTTDVFNFPIPSYGNFAVVDEAFNAGLSNNGIEGRTSEMEEEKASIAIFPNPTTDYVMLRPNLKLETQNAQVQIHDMSGKLVFQQQINFQQGNAERIELPTNLQTGGTYWVSAVSKGAVLLREALVVIKH